MWVKDPKPQERIRGIWSAHTPPRIGAKGEARIGGIIPQPRLYLTPYPNPLLTARPSQKDDRNDGNNTWLRKHLKITQYLTLPTIIRSKKKETKIEESFLEHICQRVPFLKDKAGNRFGNFTKIKRWNPLQCLACLPPERFTDT